MRHLLPTFIAATLTASISSIAVMAQSVPNHETRSSKVISMPRVVLPKEARESGLGGKVTVHVVLDEKGAVILAGDVTGPDFTCRQVVRPDVVALRNTAKAAALKTRFSPAMNDGSPVASAIDVDFQFDAPKPRPSKRKMADTGFVRYRATSDGTTKDVGDGSGSSAQSEMTTAQMTQSTGTISGGVLNGKALRLTRPVYPLAARSVRASGTVTVQVLIDTDGSMFSAQPTSGHPLLRGPSQIAACDSTFSPTLLEGKPVRVAGVIAYNFVP